MKLDPEEVSRLVKGRMRCFGDHHFGFGDLTLVSAALSGREDRAKNRFCSAAGEKARTFSVRVKQAGRPSHDFGLDGPERRKRLGVQGIFMQVQQGGPLGDFMYRGTAIVNHPEGAPVRPAHVFRTLGFKFSDDFIAGASRMGKLQHESWWSLSALVPPGSPGSPSGHVHRRVLLVLGGLKSTD